MLNMGPSARPPPAAGQRGVTHTNVHELTTGGIRIREPHRVQNENTDTTVGNDGPRRPPAWLHLPTNFISSSLKPLAPRIVVIPALNEWADIAPPAKFECLRSSNLRYSLNFLHVSGVPSSWQKMGSFFGGVLFLLHLS